MAKKKEITIEEAKKKLWEVGEISYKLKGKQKDIYNYIRNNPKDVSVVLCSRRIGKSHLLCLLAVETCIKIPNAIIKYACPQQRMVTTIIKPIMRTLLEDCPKEFKPEWMAQEKIYRFPNGSEIQVAGTDSGNAENLRGGYSSLCIVDEAGFCDDLDYVVNSIMLPTTDTTDGKLVLASTPNFKDPAHEFHESFAIPAEAEGNIAKFTIYDSPMLTPEKIQKIVDRYPGGIDNPKFRCEYLVEIPRSSETTVIPEFYYSKKDIIKSDLKKPPFYDAYVSMDVGFKDLTVALFAIYDFKEAKIKVLDEYVINGPEMTTSKLAEEIKKKEAIRFIDEETGEAIEPYLRVMDNDLKLINDLSRLHALQFVATKKDNRDAAINNARMWITEGRVEIHERCKTLIYHLENAQWNKARTDFKHMKDTPNGDILGGHADACFLPDSKVITIDGIKNIQDIVPFKDKVLTHKGRFRTVTNIMSKHHSGTILKIDSVGIEPIYCTPEHRFYSAEYKKINKNIKGQTGQKLLQQEQWIAAEKIDLNKDHLIIPEIVENIENNISLEECFIYGYWAAEGYCSQNGGSIIFAGNKKEVRVKNILQNYINKVLNHKQSKTWNKKDRKNHWKQVFEIKSKNTNGRNLGITYKPLWNTLSVLGKSDYKKLPDNCYFMSEEQIFRILCGYFFGDGYISKQGLISSTISQTLAYQILLLCNKIGLKANLNKNKARKTSFKGKNSACKDFYTIKLDRESTDAFLYKISITEEISKVFEEKLVYSQEYKKISKVNKNHRRIHGIDSLCYEGIVYNLEVDEDESYTISGVSVHNCAAFTYMIRNIIDSRNPYPEGYGRLKGNNVFYGKHKHQESEVGAWVKDMLNIKRK
jgi:hypothetical protein